MMDRYPLEVYGNNLSKRPYDPGLCAMEVMRYIGRWPHFHQCSRKPTVGIFCKQHTPEASAERARKSDERWRAKWDREMRPHHRNDAFASALRAIAKGDMNDPAGYASMVLEEWK